MNFPYLMIVNYGYSPFVMAGFATQLTALYIQHHMISLAPSSKVIYAVFKVPTMFAGRR